MELTDILNPEEMERITESFKKIVDVLVEIVNTVFKPLIKCINRCLNDILSLAPVCTTPRVLYLSNHAKRNRHRKKNKHRMMKDFIKCIRRY